MISIAEARQRISEAVAPLPAEQVTLNEAVGRVLAGDITARRTQPPDDLSAMDGYAVKAADVAKPGSSLAVIGESRAGQAFDGTVAAGQAVRIFTGAPLPDGAETILIQENTEAEGADRIRVTESVDSGRHIRNKGADFAKGDVVLSAGVTLMPRHIALLAAADVVWLAVRRKPRIAILATGDELVRPGEPIPAHGIVDSAGPGLVAYLRVLGAEALDLGIARDEAESLKRMAEGARKADMLVTVGGASVGDHDLVKQVLGDIGLDIDFWKIAMRPGKPLIFGQMADLPVLGLPGNPVSAMICALMFLGPAVDVMLGRPVTPPFYETAASATDLPANGKRQDFMRARLEDRDGVMQAEPFDVQDSAMLSTLATADCLVVRPPNAAPVRAGETVQILRLGCPL